MDASTKRFRDALERRERGRVPAVVDEPRRDAQLALQVALRCLLAQQHHLALPVVRLPPPPATHTRSALSAARHMQRFQLLLRPV